MKPILSVNNYLPNRPVLYGLAAGLMLLLSGCAFNPPAPWERGDLAKSSMRFDNDKLDSLAQKHTYFSKEAASGGSGVGGGGCGCN